MTSENFAYWLQGFFEVSDPKELSEKQIEIIKRHLNMVFFHEIDPSLTSDPVKKKALNEIHNPSIEKEEVDYKPVKRHTPFNPHTLITC